MEYIQGDITEETSGLIIHGVNCRGVMGAGVALAIKNKWPVVFEEYKSQPVGNGMLGVVQFVPIEDGLYVGNCWTQNNYGNDKRVKYASKPAVMACLYKSFQFCETHGLTLKSPKIASGLAGLDWDRDVAPIFELMQTIFPDVTVKIYII